MRIFFDSFMLMLFVGIIALILGYIINQIILSVSLTVRNKQKEEQNRIIKELTRRINNKTLNYTVEKIKSNSLPVNNFCAELKKTILNGLKEKKYKPIDGEYYWIETIAEYENFTSEKTRRILNELFAANLIELVYLCTEDNIKVLCCKLK